MSFRFEWNPYADQPHNVGPRCQRLKHHVQHAGTYFKLVVSNLRRAVPILSLYRHYRSHLYQHPVQIKKPFALSVSPAGSRNEQVIKLLKEIGVESTLVRIPSWEKEHLESFQGFFKLIKSENIELTVALLQNRDDVLRPSAWSDFVEAVFSRFRCFSSFFEVGHAWNRTKWGVWDFEEYLRLACSAQILAEKYKVKLVGPAVIDFEFHLYPPVLEKIIFDKVSSLLYVDRVGAPEDRQFGWDTPAKLALLKAVIDGSGQGKHDLWITEVNWPLKGTGKYSPAAGRPNVSEEEQADYLVRYYIFCIASGLVEKVFWWQLAAPGYGLLDTRGSKWRKRASYYAFQNMVRQLRQSTFVGRIPHNKFHIFLFQKNEQEVAVCWKKGSPREYIFSKKVHRVLSRDGLEIKTSNNKIIINESPQYVYFK